MLEFVLILNLICLDRKIRSIGPGAGGVERCIQIASGQADSFSSNDVSKSIPQCFAFDSNKILFERFCVFYKGNFRLAYLYIFISSYTSKTKYFCLANFVQNFMLFHTYIANLFTFAGITRYLKIPSPLPIFSLFKYILEISNFVKCWVDNLKSYLLS